MEFADRLKARMMALGISPSDLAKGVDVSKGNVSHWTSGTNGVSGKRLIQLAKFLDCDPVWLATGDGEAPLPFNDRTKQKDHADRRDQSGGFDAPSEEARFFNRGPMSSPPPAPDPSIKPISPIDIPVLTTEKDHEFRSAENEVEPGPPIMSAPRRVDIVGTAQLGAEGYWYDIENGVEGWVETWTKDPDAYALRLKGDSMSPAIRSGWIAVCEPSHRLVPGEYVMVTLVDGQSMVKELLFEREDEVVLSSINAAYERRTIARSEIEKIHYVGNIMAPSKVMCRL